MKHLRRFLSILLLCMIIMIPTLVVNAASANAKLKAPVVSASNVTSTGKVKLTWNKVSGAVSYKVYRAESSGGKYTLMKTTTGTSYTNTSASAGKTYYYKVKAIASDSSRNSSFSSVKSKTCKLTRPTVSVSNVASTGKIKLTWKKIDGAEKYRVYRASSSGGTYSLIKTTTSTSYTDTSAKSAKKYYYKVKAVHTKSTANSAYSAVKSRGCDLPRPTVSISLNSDKKPKLTWNSVSVAKEYKVYRSTSKNGTYKLIKTTTSRTYSNNSATEGITYYYKVVAAHSKSGYNSAYSSVKSIKVPTAENVTLKTRYVSDAWITVFKSPDSSSEPISLPYMAKVTLGEAVTKGTSGSWNKLYHNNNLYYIWITKESEKLTATKSSLDYTGKTKYQQDVIDLAMKIYREWDTVYVHGQSKGEKNDDGTYGFDCSGFVSYVLNTAMQKYVPAYKLSANITSLYKTDDVYNGGYRGEFVAKTVDIEDLQPGDILFFDQNEPIDHCGIYLGNNEFIHSSYSWDKAVCIMPISKIYKEELSAIRRYIPTTVTPANKTMYINTGCRLYEKASDTSKNILGPDGEVFRFKKGDPVTVLYSGNGNWAYVRSKNNLEGFALVKYLSKSAPTK